EGNGRATQAWVPTLDVWETDDEFVFAFDLPGIPESDISIELDDGALTVSAKREHTGDHKEDGFYRCGARTGRTRPPCEHTGDHKEDGFYRFERRYGMFSRTVGIPQGVGENDVHATYK